MDKEAVRTSQAPPWTRMPSRHVMSGRRGGHVRMPGRHVTSRHVTSRRQAPPERTMLSNETVFDVRRGHEERVAQTTCPRRKKKEEILKRRRLFEEQPSPKAILSTFLSRLSHQASSAAILCSRPQAISHLAVVSGWWAAVSQPSNINLRWSWVGGRLFLNY